MNSGIFTNRFFRKIQLIFTVLLLLIVMTVVVFYLYSLQNIQSEQLMLTRELVGKLALAYPQSEADIVKTVLQQKDAHFIEIGTDILEKYGLNSGVNPFRYTRFQESYLKYSFSFLALIIVVMLANSLLLFYVGNRGNKKISELSAFVEKIAEGKYDYVPKEEEGSLGRLNVQIYQLSRRIKLSMERFIREKENIKALVTDISHQIKTPLSSIKLFNSLLMEDETDIEETKEFLSRSRDEINRLEWLAGSLIKISRLESGMIELSKEQCSLNETVKSAIDGIMPKAVEKNINVTLDSEKNLCALHDSKWTSEAIFNVLENGVKYTGEGGWIKLGLIEMESFIRLDIEDNGIGVHKEEYNDIFKRFYRGKTEQIRKTEGSGVGLYLTRKILEEQGGSIIVDSTIGCGTRFSLFLQKCQQV